MSVLYCHENMRTCLAIADIPTLHLFRAVRHDFQNELLHRVKRSYLKPCAHPWAALVLFDSLLVGVLFAFCAMYVFRVIMGV